MNKMKKRTLRRTGLAGLALVALSISLSQCEKKASTPVSGAFHHPFGWDLAGALR